MWLAAVTKGYACPLWLTLRQALELGGHFRKGEAGELVVYVDRIHAAYIASRIMVLKDDKRAIFSAAVQCTKRSISSTGSFMVRCRDKMLTSAQFEAIGKFAIVLRRR